MLSDEVIEKVTERLVNRIEQGNTYILEQIGKSIKKIGTLSPSKAQELVQIMRYGGDYDKIVKKLAEITKLNVKDIKKIFEEVAKSDYQFAKQFYDYRGKKFIPYSQNEVLKRQVDALTNTMIDNYISKTKAIGFSLKDDKGNVIFRTLEQTYQDAIDKAVVSISQGKTTFGQEMYGLMKEIGGSGIKTMDYESGRSMRLDSYFRMLTKDSLRELHNEEQQLFGEEFDADGVEISVHGHPAPDHELVQGRQFSNEEFDKFQNDKGAVSYDGIEFPATSEETGYDRRSISEYNCYHYVFAIVLGVSEPEYSNKELQQIIDNNNKGFDFDGKHYTMYEGTQLQRKLETEIRKQKDIQIMGKAGGNELLVYDSQQKITQLTRKYKELSDASGLPTKMGRMRVAGYKREKISNGLKAGSNNFRDFYKNKPDNVNYIEKIDITDQKIIDEKLIEYSKIIKNEDIEHGYIIDKNGYVFEIIGNEKEFKIPKWLDVENAIGIHNHPKKVTNFSFSYDDIDLFLRGKLKEFHGFDYKYEYVLKNNPKIKIKDGLEIKRQWKEIEDFLEEQNMLGNVKYNIDKVRFHYINNEMSKIYKYTYNRENNLHYK